MALVILATSSTGTSVGGVCQGQGWSGNVLSCFNIWLRKKIMLVFYLLSTSIAPKAKKSHSPDWSHLLSFPSSAVPICFWLVLVYKFINWQLSKAIGNMWIKCHSDFLVRSFKWWCSPLCDISVLVWDWPTTSRVAVEDSTSLDTCLLSDRLGMSKWHIISINIFMGFSSKAHHLFGHTPLFVFWSRSITFHCCLAASLDSYKGLSVSAGTSIMYVCCLCVARHLDLCHVGQGPAADRHTS